MTAIDFEQENLQAAEQPRQGGQGGRPDKGSLPQDQGQNTEGSQKDSSQEKKARVLKYGEKIKDRTQ